MIPKKARISERLVRCNPAANKDMLVQKTIWPISSKVKNLKNKLTGVMWQASKVGPVSARNLETLTRLAFLDHPCSSCRYSSSELLSVRGGSGSSSELASNSSAGCLGLWFLRLGISSSEWSSKEEALDLDSVSDNSLGLSSKLGNSLGPYLVFQRGHLRTRYLLKLKRCGLCCPVPSCSSSWRVFCCAYAAWCSPDARWSSTHVIACLHTWLVPSSSSSWSKSWKFSFHLHPFSLHHDPFSFHYQ